MHAGWRGWIGPRTVGTGVAGSGREIGCEEVVVLKVPGLVHGSVVIGVFGWVWVGLTSE
jgi:hypothetical protein